jgi:hypothetical protein
MSFQKIRVLEEEGILQTLQEERARGKTDPEIIRDTLLGNPDVGYIIKELIEKEDKYMKDIKNVELEYRIFMAKKQKMEENKTLVLRKWQSEIEGILHHTPDDRLIYIVCDEIGDTGKTKLAQYLSLKYGNVVFAYKPWMSQNIYHLTRSRYKSVFGPKLILCDLPRARNITPGLVTGCQLLKSDHTWLHPPHIVLLTSQPVPVLKSVLMNMILKKWISHNDIRIGVITGEKLEWFRHCKSNQGQWISCEIPHPPLSSIPSQEDETHAGDLGNLVSAND